MSRGMRILVWSWGPRSAMFETREPTARSAWARMRREARIIRRQRRAGIAACPELDVILTVRFGAIYMAHLQNLSVETLLTGPVTTAR
jgi:hypothetical protein